MGEERREHLSVKGREKREGKRGGKREVPYSIKLQVIRDTQPGKRDRMTLSCMLQGRMTLSCMLQGRMTLSCMLQGREEVY